MRHAERHPCRSGGDRRVAGSVLLKKPHGVRVRVERLEVGLRQVRVIIIQPGDRNFMGTWMILIRAVPGPACRLVQGAAGTRLM